MATIPYIFNDANLTDPFDDASDTLGASAVQGASDFGVFWIGTTTSGNKLEIDSGAGTPGVDPIQVSIVDADGALNVEATDIKLSLSSDFSGATGGATLDVSVSIQHGAPVPVYYQWTNATGGGTYTDISLQLSAIQEVAI